MDWDPVTHYQDVRVAQRYDEERFRSLSGRAFDALEKSFVRRAFRDVPRHAQVLDLPCGTGRLAECLLEEGFEVTGIDISPAMLEVARRKLERYGTRFHARVGDVRTLAGQDERRYDVALCARVLMHFPLEEQISFLRGVAALAVGRVVFTHSLDSPYQRLRRGVKRVLRHPAPVRHPVDDAELRQLLVGAGLREVRRLRPMPLISEEIIVVAEHL
jgi:2-polyprenyl-3-methyl-5-hydroxy-6-metoxy-1,4-benzoquinol methylase